MVVANRYVTRIDTYNTFSYQNSENVICTIGSIWTKASIISEKTGEGVQDYHYMLKKQRVANKHRKVANNL